MDVLENPLPLSKDGTTIDIRTRNTIKRAAMPLLVESLTSFFPDAEITSDGGGSIFISIAVPPRGDNPALTFRWELKSTIKSVEIDHQ